MDHARKKDLYNSARTMYYNTRDLQLVSDTLGVARSTITRWCKDLQVQFPTKSEQEQIRKNEQILRLRKEAREDKNFNLEAYAKRENIEYTCLSKALRGDTFKHLNNREAPVKRDMSKSVERDKARELRLQGLGCNKIAQMLAVSKASVAMWCSDINEEERQKKIAAGIAVPKRGTVSAKGKGRYKSLTIQDAVDIRRAIRKDGYFLLRERAEKYGVNITSISYAARGQTHAAANEFEPPITEKLPLPPKPVPENRRYKVDETLVAEAIRLRREDPIRWTYGELAGWFSHKSGREYRATHVARILRNRDPSLAELEKLNLPQVRPSIRQSKQTGTFVNRRLVKKTVSSMRVLSGDEVKRRLEERSLKAAIERADRYEVWVNAGRPDWGEFVD